MISFSVTKSVCPFEPEIVNNYINELKNFLSPANMDPKSSIEVQADVPGQSECDIRITVQRSSGNTDSVMAGQSPPRDIYHVKLYYGTFAAKRQSIIRVSIEPFYNSPLPKDQYDHFLEGLKLNTKNILLKAWKPAHCSWLHDQQSIDLSSWIYTPINNTENALRALISQVMTSRFGPAWWDKIEFTKLKNKYFQRRAGYARAVPNFGNVDDFLMALDADDLTMILETEFKKWIPAFTDNIDLAIKSKNEKQLLTLLEDQLTTTLSLWNEVFSEYLSEKFRIDWKNFCKNRNHIAHNKFVDFNLFKEFRKTIGAVNKVLNDALNDFDQSLISDEDYLEAFDEPETIETVEERLGYDFYREPAIRNMFMEYIDQYTDVISDALSVRQDLIVETMVANIDVTHTVLTVTSKVDSGIMTMQIRDLDIDDSSGCTSSITLEILENGTSVDERVLSITNPDVHFDSEKGYDVLEVDTEVNLTDAEEIADWFIEAVEEIFIPPAEKVVDMLRFSRIDQGGEVPFGEFACPECGEDTVIINESAGQIGQCITCGEEHDITECLRCGENLIGTEPTFCENCQDFIDRQ